MNTIDKIQFYSLKDNLEAMLLLENRMLLVLEKKEGKELIVYVDNDSKLKFILDKKKLNTKDSLELLTSLNLPTSLSKTNYVLYGTLTKDKIFYLYRVFLVPGINSKTDFATCAPYETFLNITDTIQDYTNFVKRASIIHSGQYTNDSLGIIDKLNGFNIDKSYYGAILVPYTNQYCSTFTDFITLEHVFGEEIEEVIEEEVKEVINEDNEISK